MPTPEEIKSARVVLGETQTVFAARFGVDQSTVHRWETEGVPNNGTARLIVEQFLARFRHKAQPTAEPASIDQP